MTDEGQAPEGVPTQDGQDGPVGLTTSEVAARLRTYGPNVVKREPTASAVTIAVRQFANPFVWLLLVAAGIAAVLGEVVDASAIATIVVLNALVGFLQEYRAERAVAALRAMTAPRARVERDGRSVMIRAEEVVPGDLLLLEEGDVVAADGTLVEAHQLLTNEAALTGESMAAQKSTTPSPGDAPLAERRDRVFMGTAVAHGIGRAKVTATGMGTELGKIAHLLATTEEGDTPLQRRLARVSRVLLVSCLSIVGLVALLGTLRGLAAMEVFLSAVSLAVAAVPEGLPAVVTIALALGVRRMVSHHVLVRRLPAIETLGCATVICTDKTGTLTTGVMKVREHWARDERALLHAAVACSDAHLDATGRSGSGDPTEVALLLAAAAQGIRREDLDREAPRRHVHAFDSDRKRMSILRSDGVLYVKGAVESVVPLCTSGTEDVHLANLRMAEAGLRVLAVAIGRGSVEQDLRLLGLVGIADPPRPEAIEAVAAARAAGIRTVMITGDHAATATAIARELGIVRPGEPAEEVVHARATPVDKLTIVQRWRSRGEIVAMTGDGVNDAPALREADIGIAMGQTGTEVTREAADIILTDDHFASIVAAIREGRGIFDNIRKTIVYLLAGNASELAVMLGAAIVGLPVPLLPLHLLWINLVTDGLPALALVTDPVDPDVMRRPPRRPDEPMLARSQWGLIAWTGLLEATVTLGVFAWALRRADTTEADARSLAFSTLVFAELLRAFAARSDERLFWEVGVFTNVRLLGVVVASVGLQLALHGLPFTQTWFGLGAFSHADGLLAFGLGAIPVSILELGKLVRRARGRRRREPR